MTFVKINKFVILLNYFIKFYYIKIMSLKKFFSLFFIFIFSLLLISYIFIYKFLEFGFLFLKKEEAKKVISKVEFYFQKELDKLHNLTKDWAAWDEAYL
ncbi:MAG: hypothetical protein C0169_06375, partial [Thermodesulfobacterium geofontis]